MEDRPPLYYGCAICTMVAGVNGSFKGISSPLKSLEMERMENDYQHSNWSGDRDRLKLHYLERRTWS
jgi:hypothetical protein